jgi:hypothetical protein
MDEGEDGEDRIKISWKLVVNIHGMDFNII